MMDSVNNVHQENMSLMQELQNVICADVDIKTIQPPQDVIFVKLDISLRNMKLVNDVLCMNSQQIQEHVNVINVDQEQKSMLIKLDVFLVHQDFSRMISDLVNHVDQESFLPILEALLV